MAIKIKDKIKFGNNSSFIELIPRAGTWRVVINGNQVMGGAGGGAAAPSVRGANTGGNPASTATDGTDTTPIVTEAYIAELPVLSSGIATGIAVLNGTLVAGNIIVILYDGSGAVVAQSASTAAAGAAGYQRVPFVTPVQVSGPATYYVGLQSNNTGYRFRSHAVGNFGTFRDTGEVFGTVTPLATPPSTFVANVGPIASLY